MSNKLLEFDIVNSSCEIGCWIRNLCHVGVIVAAVLLKLFVTCHCGFLIVTCSDLKQLNEVAWEATNRLLNLLLRLRYTSTCEKSVLNYSHAD